jgi:hypothetical protein
MKRRILIVKESFREKLEEIKEELKSQNVPVEGSADEACLIFTGEMEEEAIDAVRKNPFIEEVEDDDEVSAS